MQINKITFYKFSPGNLLIILYQLTKIESASFKLFCDIFITSFQCLNLQRTIAKKNIYFF